MPYTVYCSKIFIARLCLPRSLLYMYDGYSSPSPRHPSLSPRPKSQHTSRTSPPAPSRLLVLRGLNSSLSAQDTLQYRIHLVPSIRTVTVSGGNSRNHRISCVLPKRGPTNQNIPLPEEAGLDTSLRQTPGVHASCFVLLYY